MLQSAPIDRVGAIRMMRSVSRTKALRPVERPLVKQAAVPLVAGALALGRAAAPWVGRNLLKPAASAVGTAAAKYLAPKLLANKWTRALGQKAYGYLSKGSGKQARMLRQLARRQNPDISKMKGMDKALHAKGGLLARSRLSQWRGRRNAAKAGRKMWAARDYGAMARSGYKPGHLPSQMRAAKDGGTFTLGGHTLAKTRGGGFMHTSRAATKSGAGGGRRMKNYFSPQDIKGHLSTLGALGGKRAQGLASKALNYGTTGLMVAPFIAPYLKGAAGKVRGAASGAGAQMNAAGRGISNALQPKQNPFAA